MEALQENEKYNFPCDDYPAQVIEIEVDFCDFYHCGLEIQLQLAQSHPIDGGFVCARIVHFLFRLNVQGS
jgi:hypothetical protein